MCRIQLDSLPGEDVFRQILSGADARIVACLAHEIWNEHYVNIIGQKQVDYMLEKFQSVRAITEQIESGQEYFLIVSRNEPVGYLSLLPDYAASRILLSKLYVRKEARGLGLAKAALQFVSKRCEDAGIRTIWLTVNKNNTQSISWYERNGFCHTGPVVQDIGGGFVMDDYKMEKPVGAS